MTYGGILPSLLDFSQYNKLFLEKCEEVDLQFYDLHYFQCLIMLLIKLNIKLAYVCRKAICWGQWDNNLVSYYTWDQFEIVFNQVFFATAHE